jgi:hypothetical protein
MEVDKFPTANFVAVSNEPVPLPDRIERLLEPALVTTKSKKLCFTRTFSILQVCGLPSEMSPSHSSEK